MYLKEITIRHYKSIKDTVHLRDFSPFHILVGPNNAGKTNIFDAMHVFFDKNLEEERYYDKDADIEMVLKYENKEYKISCKGREINDPHNITDKEHFIRVDDNSDYRDVAKQLKSFKNNYPEEYNKFSKTIEDHFKEIEMNEDLFLLNVLSENKKRPIKRMGEGFKRLFVILFYIFNPKYNIILIDEPETHLHPSIIRSFLHILEKKELKNQVFFTTHHPSFVQAKHLPKTWRIARNKNGNTFVYGFSKEKININRFIQEINDDNSGMLFSDKVLLVEGVSDRIFMREMIDKFYNKNKDIKVVYTSGKGSIDLYADLCELYNIPYAIMLDRDALDTASLKRVKKYPKITKKLSLEEKLKELRNNDIFILEKDLEKVYPNKFSKYIKKETKPLAALIISQKINKRDLEDKNMRIVKNLLERI